MIRRLIALTMFSVCTPSFAQAPQQPSEAHDVLAHDAGTWDTDVKMYFQGPNGPPSESKGVETTELICGGLYARATYRGKMGGADFEGHGLTGYDPRTKEYVGTWVDNFSAVPTQLKGTYDEQTKQLTMRGSVFDVTTGQELKVKQITTFVDEKTKNFESFLVFESNGQEVEIKLMETTAKKRE